MNTILFITLISILYLGYLQFANQRENVTEVDHVEPDGKDEVKCIPYTRYSLHGVGGWRRFILTTQKNHYRELNK